MKSMNPAALQMRLDILHALVANLYATAGSPSPGGPELDRRLEELRRRHSAERAEFDRALAEMLAPIQESLDRQARDTGGA